MKIKQYVMAILTSGIIISQTGCLVLGAVGAGAGTAMYVRGDLETKSSKPVGEVYSVVEQTCKDLKFEI